MDESWDDHVTPLLLGCNTVCDDSQGISPATTTVTTNNSSSSSTTLALSHQHDSNMIGVEHYFNTPELLVSGQPPTTTSSASPLSGSLSPGGGSAPGALSPGGGSSQGASLGGAGGNSAGAAGAGSSQCCESGRPIVTDPMTGQSVCSCQYDSARLALSQYPRSVGVYGTPYPSTDQNPYPSIGVDNSFYSPLSNPYALKDGSGSADMSAWTSAGLQPTTGYYPYDPALGGIVGNVYGYGTGYDLAARRKNATRESTATLKAWLNEHKKNPYPTKGEKIMLAIITKMTLTQVSTWFANARRRLKKENKMTWEPKNKTDDDDDAILSDSDDKEKDDMMMDEKRDDTDIHGRVKSERGNVEDDDLTDDERKDNLHHHMHHMLSGSVAGGIGGSGGNYGLKTEMKTTDCGVPLPASKPKIWSLADTAACKTPPPPPPAAPNHWIGSGGGNASGSFVLPSAARYGGFLSSVSGHCQQGFPEVQTDTPPQTPPNMKLPSVAGNLVAAGGGAQPPCQAPYGPPTGFLPSGFGRPTGVPSGGHHHHNHQQASPSMVGPHHQSHMTVSNHQQDTTAFKPFYKSTSQSISGGFVAPV